MTQRVLLGRIVATPAAIAALADSNQSPQEFLKRHQAGDWGDCCPEDRLANDQAIINGERLLSVYRTARGEKIWIITEWDRSVTTVLMPDDY